LVLLIVHIEQPIPRPVAKERKCTIQVRRYTAVKNQRMVNNHNDDILHKAADHKKGGSVNLRYYFFIVLINKQPKAWLYGI
jgi:hypothetical protein